MGGLIVKEAYIQGGIDPQYQDLIRNVSAVLFLATPHRGSNFAETLNRILSVSLVSAPKEYVSDMIKNSATLQRINETFRHVIKGLDIVSLYETRPTRIGFDGNRIVRPFVSLYTRTKRANDGTDGRRERLINLGISRRNFQGT